MAKRRASTPLEGKVDFTPAPETTASPFEATPQENSAFRQTALEERVAALEATVAALVFSTFGARDSKGNMLVRCRCGCFATRRVRVVHRFSGTHVEELCAACKPATPLASIEISEIEENAILDQADRAQVERANRGILQAREWSSS